VLVGLAHFSHPARIVLVVASMLMASAAFFSEANLSSGEREDRSNRWIFLSLLVIGLLSAFLPAYTERKGWLASRWRYRPLDWRVSLCCGWRAANLAHLRSWPPIQRAGGHSAQQKHKVFLCLFC
jgi:hypothetical protein